MVKRTGIVRRCEECIVTRKTGVFEGIFANSEIGLRRRWIGMFFFCLKQDLRDIDGFSGWW
ncbi:MAG: hypothetical protein OXI52_01110, partial [Caldilineaceae bacterium]|nr:hypothetical protein [Caldilineaceae bacterium]